MTTSPETARLPASASRIVVLLVALATLAACGATSATGAGGTTGPAGPTGPTGTTGPAAPTASFTSTPSTPAAGQSVQFTDTSTGGATAWAWAFGDGSTSAVQHPAHAFAAAGTFTIRLTVTGLGGSTSATASVTVTAAPPPGGGGPAMNTENTISDQAQSATIAFDGLAFVTGTFCAQTFYPPGKVADFFGFQYLRDNDPSRLGHNTEFTTLTADPVLAMLTDGQVATFVALAQQEQALSDAYGYARFPLAKAFRRLADADLPTGTAGLSRDAVKSYSAELFAIDGEMSWLRARAYASVLGSMTSTQLAVLDAMKGTGASTWAQPSAPPASLTTHGQYSVQLRTYAGEMLAWYVGNVDSDVYFCPERQGTYFGSFFMKDVKAMHNPSYTIDSNMTADMGDAFLAALDATQRAKVTALVSRQRTDLLALVAKRNQISTALRNLRTTGGTVDEATITALSRQYGELDGEISYFYATAFSEVAATLTTAQKATLLALRKTATAESGGSPDYDATCGNGYLYSAPLSSPPVIASTDFLFGSSAFALSSTAFVDGGRIASSYTCDGAGSVPPLAWSSPPTGTVEYALTLTTLAADGTKYNWVLYGIPASATEITDATSVGTSGKSTDGPDLRYYAPCSTGPGDKTYIFTLYALSAAPTFSVPAAQVDGPALEAAVAPLTLGSRTISFVYARTGL